MWLLIDPLEWESIKRALTEDFSIKERRSVALSITPKNMLKYLCESCTIGRLPNEKMVWGVFVNGELVHVIFNESSMYMFKESNLMTKNTEIKQVRVGWK